MLRVMIAEDEDIIRKGLIYTTDWMGMDCVVVAEAANGQEGLLKILEQKPDVVIAMEYNPAALQALWWCRRNGKKFIHLTDGTLFSERNIGKIQKVTRKIITKNCDAAIASSTRAKEKLLAWGVPEEKIFVSLLTVDVQAYFIAH